MPGETILPVGCAAEADTCGSCKFFRRIKDNGDWYFMHGHCRIKLPGRYVEQWQVRKPDPKTGEYEKEDPDRIKDTDTCDLYRNDGKIYIVQRLIKPKE
jgi:hypothetical protein